MSVVTRITWVAPADAAAVNREEWLNCKIVATAASLRQAGRGDHAQHLGNSTFVTFEHKDHKIFVGILQSKLRRRNIKSNDRGKSTGREILFGENLAALRIDDKDLRIISMLGENFLHPISPGVLKELSLFLARQTSQAALQQPGDCRHFLQ